MQRIVVHPNKLQNVLVLKIPGILVHFWRVKALFVLLVRYKALHPLVVAPWLFILCSWASRRNMECQYLAWLKALHDVPMGLVQGSFEDVGEGNVGTLSVEVLPCRVWLVSGAIIFESKISIHRIICVHRSSHNIYKSLSSIFIIVSSSHVLVSCSRRPSNVVTWSYY